MKNTELHQTTVKTIEGCLDCPMCDPNEFCTGHKCRLLRNSEWIKVTKYGLPITPSWCPIKKSDFIFKWTEKKATE